MSRKLLVILLVFGLLMGNLIFAPVARADNAWYYVSNQSFSTWDYGGTIYAYVTITKYTGYMSGVTANFSNGSIVARAWAGGGLTAPGGGMTVFGDDGTFYSGVNGSTVRLFQQYKSGGYGGYDGTSMTCSWLLSDGGSIYQGTANALLGSNSGNAVPSTSWVEAVPYVEPLSVTIDSGPTSVDLVNGGTWHAAAIGGTTPYTYYWDWAPLGGTYHYNTPFDPIGPTGTDTYSHTWSTAGTYVLECMVQDAEGTWADATYQVSAASVIGSYHALFARYGDKGQYLNVQVDDAAGNPVTISSTAGTQYGLYEAGGAFGWFAADSEAAQLVTYTWRWVMSYTVTPPGLALPPPADFWIETSIHLAVPNIDLEVTHHFTGLLETLDPWYGPKGNPLVPETPPSETSTLPDWLTPVYDMFVRLFRYLFDPGSTTLSSQIASGWVTIASPVPTITPQYTIPFPNPNHLLAATGDSVDISFAAIQTWTYYSTVKTIVQIVLDAILVFVVISIVT